MTDEKLAKISIWRSDWVLLLKNLQN